MDKMLLDYNYLIDEFGEERIVDRCNWLMDAMSAFIDRNDLNKSAFVSETILFHVVVDYFADIQRLKEFQSIETSNHIKVFSYITYWVLRHKPIQVKTDVEEKNVFVNEQFCSEMIRAFLFDNPADVSILKQDEDAINDFIDTMIYYFKYREVNPQCIELMLISFIAGRSYQNSVDHQN